MATPPRDPNSRLMRRESSTAPTAFGATALSTRRLRSNSGGLSNIPQDLDLFTTAELNSVAPPAPVYKIVLTGGPCGGKTTSLARVSLCMGCIVCYGCLVHSIFISARDVHRACCVGPTIWHCSLHIIFAQ